MFDPRGTGDITFTCKNSQTTWSSTNVIIENPGDREEVSCTFTASGKVSIVQLIPSDPMIVSTFERSFSTAMVDGNTANGGDSDGTGTAILMLFGALALIGVLVGAILLTREREEEVERDIFNYCPACDGELEVMKIDARIVRSIYGKHDRNSTIVMHAVNRFTT